MSLQLGDQSVGKYSLTSCNCRNEVFMGLQSRDEEAQALLFLWATSGLGVITAFC